MISKEDLKQEIDTMPDSLLERVHSFIQEELKAMSTQTRSPYLSDEWVSNLNEFTSDFMESRESYGSQNRESLD